MRWGQDRSFGLGLFLAVKVSAAIDCTHALGGVFGDLLCQRLRVTEAQKHRSTEAHTHRGVWAHQLFVPD